jgi:hypothetical protein
MHTFEGFYQVNSGGHATFGQAGIQLQFSKMMLHANYQLPVSQSFNSDDHVHIESKGRFSVTMIAFIGEKSNSGIFEFQ